MRSQRLGSAGIGGHQPIKRRHGLRPRLARGMPVGLRGGQGGLHAPVVRVELGQCFVQPQVFGEHPDAAREVGVGMEQESQFFGGPVGIVPDDRRGGPEGGAAPPSGQQLPAVWGKRECMHLAQLDAAVIQLHQLTPRLDIPEADRLVAAARGQCATIRRKRHGHDCTGMPLERFQKFPGGDVPQLHGPLMTGQGQGLAVRRKGHILDRALPLAMARRSCPYRDSGASASLSRSRSTR